VGGSIIACSPGSKQSVSKASKPKIPWLAKRRNGGLTSREKKLIIVISLKRRDDERVALTEARACLVWLFALLASAHSLRARSTPPKLTLALFSHPHDRSPGGPGTTVVNARAPRAVESSSAYAAFGCCLLLPLLRLAATTAAAASQGRGRRARGHGGQGVQGPRAGYVALGSPAASGWVWLCVARALRVGRGERLQAAIIRVGATKATRVARFQAKPAPNRP